MSLPSLQRICSKFLYENCDNIDDVYQDELIPNHVKKGILNGGAWYCTETNTDRKQYEFRKMIHEQDLKIHGFSINIYNTIGSQRLEVCVNTYKSEVYFNVINKAQELNKNQYMFKSLYDHFQKLKDSNGLCTVEAVQNWRSRIGSELFDRIYLEYPLIYHSTFNTQEELTKKINEVLTILQQADSSTETITKYLRLDFKA